MALFQDKKIAHPFAWSCALTGGWLVLDQLVKAWERASMSEGSSIELIKGAFYLTYVHNTGAAFSAFSGQRWLFLLAAVIAVGALVALWLYEKPDTVLPVVGSGLLLGGALGNVVDRLLYHQVLDLFDARFINFAVFNVADIGITVGAACFVIWVLFAGGLSGEARE